MRAKKKKPLVVLAALGLCFFSGLSASANSIDEVVNDMKYGHDWTLHGVPSWYSWAKAPKVSKRGAQPDARAILFWNQVYEPDSLNPSWNARVQIRNPRVYVLYDDNKWYRVQAGTTTDWGANYREDFANNENKPADVTWSSEGWAQIKSGSKSSAGTGFNYHGYLSWRSGVWGPTMRGVFATCEARLIGDSNGKYLMGVGADLYTATSWGNNLYDVGIGRHKWVRPEWRSFNMHNLTESQIRQNPPPLNQ